MEIRSMSRCTFSGALGKELVAGGVYNAYSVVNACSFKHLKEFSGGEYEAARMKWDLVTGTDPISWWFSEKSDGVNCNS